MDKSILQEAEEIVNGERAQPYGPALTSFSNIAKGWSVITGTEITPQQVGLMMMWLKICRENNKHQRDNLTDVAGYAHLVQKMEEEINSTDRPSINLDGIIYNPNSQTKETDEGPKSDNGIYLDEINKMPFGAYYVYWKLGGRSVTTFGYDKSGKRWIAPANWINMDKTYVEDIIDDILYFELIAENKH